MDMEANEEQHIHLETIQDVSIRRNGSIIKSTSQTFKKVEVTKNHGKFSVKKTQNIFQFISELIKIREQPTTKEIGTLILLGIMLVLFIISVTGFFVMWFTEYYNDTLLSNLVLAEGSETANSWMNPKFDTLLKVHIFNYTNIEQYLSGVDDKIIVKDIGPLTYREHTVKVNVSFNNNHTVTFRDHRSYTFVPEKSTSGEFENIIVPNVPLLTAAVKIESLNALERAYALFRIGLFRESLFKKLTIHEFLWGYPDRIVQLKIGTGLKEFGILMSRNGTSVDSLQINTGEADIQKFSTITQFNGMPSLGFWNDGDCNRIDGSDASMFPPHMVLNRTILNVFLQVLCRKISLHFEKEVMILNNIKALRYRTPLNVFATPEENPDNKCYCENTERCMPSGVINATKCYNGAPIFPSFPHFFSGDPMIYKDFEGIKPEAELHQTYADIHPRFAFPMSGASRVQINIALHKGPSIKGKGNRLEEGAILPLIWIEITSNDFTEDIIDSLYISTFGLDAIQFALKYGTLLTCVTSFSIIVLSFYYLTRKREEEKIKNEEKVLTSVDETNVEQIISVSTAEDET